MSGNASKQIVWLSFCLMAASFLVSCIKKSDHDIYLSWISFPPPTQAKNLKVETPNFVEQFKNNYFFATFELEPEPMAKFLSLTPGDFSAWSPLTEVYVHKHFFTHIKYPNALQSIRAGGGKMTYFIADPSSGMVYALAWAE
jgi:hypothetical protein